MPTDPLIYATSDQTIATRFMETLNADLMNQLGSNCFREDDALSVVPWADVRLHAENLPPSSTLIQANPCSPFYGPGYERGDWPILAAIIEFLRRRIPDSRVWYGDDCSGTVNETTDAWMKWMWDHWAIHGGRPYDRHRD